MQRQIGEIGLFIVNGNGYIKQLQDGYLHSLNPEYDDIQLDESDTTRIVGRVLGAVNKNDYPNDDELKILQEGKLRKFVSRVNEITFSGPVAAGKGRKVLYVTERAVFELKKDGMHLIEIAPGVDLQTQVLDQIDFKPIIEDVKLMDERIFRDEPMGLVVAD